MENIIDKCPLVLSMTMQYGHFMFIFALVSKLSKGSPQKRGGKVWNFPSLSGPQPARQRESKSLKEFAKCNAYYRHAYLKQNFPVCFFIKKSYIGNTDCKKVYTEIEDFFLFVFHN